MMQLRQKTLSDALHLALEASVRDGRFSSLADARENSGEVAREIIREFGAGERDPVRLANAVMIERVDGVDSNVA